MIFIYVPCHSVDEAKTVGRLLVEKRIAAKIDIIPTQSVFRGADGVKEISGAAMIIKTIDKNNQLVEDFVKDYYKNRIPCVATFMLYRMNREFREWLIASTG